jgi:two-component system, NarL family, response regulator NreC
MSGDVIRVMIADDHAVVRAGLKSVLGSAKDIEVVGEASNGREAVTMAALIKPDVLVMDLSMPELDGTGAMKEIAASGLATRVLILSMHAEEDYLIPVMEAGAAGFLAKSDADRSIVDAVRAVAYGDVYVRPTAAAILARNLTKKDAVQSEREKYEKLTARERDVLRLVGQGYSAPEIGTKLFISPKTVDTYKQRIQEKLNFNHRSQYVQFVYKLGLLNQA